MINIFFRDGAGADRGLVSKPVSHRTEKNIGKGMPSYERVKPDPNSKIAEPLLDASQK